MVQDSIATTVVFRVDSEGNVFALFPDVPADVGKRYCTAYAHIGQHSAADYAGCVRDSRPATEAEYAPLARELEQIGYKLTIRSRRMPWRNRSRV